MGMLTYDVLVIGGGHAGIEAAYASARLGQKTLLVTMHLDLIGQMSCNPSIGGIGKGHLVREIDAMGGAMASLADSSGLQFKLLNTRKGAAVQAIRAQCDRSRYRIESRRLLDQESNIHLRQGEVTALCLRNGRIVSATLHDGSLLTARVFVLTTGTFLNGLLHVGLDSTSGGRGGERASSRVSQTLSNDCGLILGRMKTGTPPRLLGRSVNFDKMVEQPGDNPIPFFSIFSKSYRSLFFDGPQKSCYLTTTTEQTKEIIEKNLDRSPLYSGKIRGVGPRYCPSIEDKIVKFPHRASQHIFVEPEGLDVDEFYPNGISTSLPVDVQEQIVHSIPGMEEAVILRPGYAVEYDFVFPDQLHRSLQTKTVENLFLAGQINGTTGYEEAASQGLVAGINAGLHASGQPGWAPNRNSSYLGVMVDDLVTHSVDEPYRMFTSRAENRLYIRNDNAAERLSPVARLMGLLSPEKILELDNRLKFHQETRAKLQKFRFQGKPLLDRVKIPDESLQELLRVHCPDLHASSREDWVSSLEQEIKYEGYIRISNDRWNQTDDLIIPSDFFDRDLPGISNEVRSRLKKERPKSLIEAKGLRGVTPGAIDLLRVSILKLSSSSPKAYSTTTADLSSTDDPVD